MKKAKRILALVMSVLMLTTMNSWVYAADSAVEAPAAEPAPAEEPAPTETPQETPAVTPAVTPEAEPTEAPSEPAPQADSTKEAVPADSQPQSTASAVSGPESASATPAPTPEVKYVTSFTVTSHNVTVTATTTDAAKFPEGTQLHVDYAAPGSALYQSTIGTVEQSLGIAGDETRSAEGVVYDIYFTYNGNRIEPDDAVSVTMNFASPVASDLPEGSSMENSCVMHVTGGGAENVGASVGTTSEGAVTDASFRSDSFSPYFVGGVRRAPGNTTDTQSGNVSSNLNDFTTSVSIDAKEDASGNYVVEKGVAYKIHLTFQEDDESNGKQFGNPLTYTLPAGFHDIDHSFADFTITVNDPDGSSYKVSGNKVSLVNGTLTVTFNESDPNWLHLEKARNTQFFLDLQGTFDDNAKELDWGNGKKTSLSVDTSGSLTTVKQANYDRSDGKVHYTVTVTSHGYNTNVIVKDSLTGTALTYNQNVTSSVTGGKVKSQTERGFEYVIPEMTDGQTATLTYAASVNFDALGGGQGTEEQVGNSVVTTSDQQPNSEPVQENWTNKIDYLSISKQAGAASDGTVPGHKTIPWTVTYNADRKGSAAGRTINDSIAEDSRSILKYSGDGIKVAVTDAGGNVVRTDSVSWANVGVTDPASASSWHYTVPDDKEAYQYTVSYTTDADLTSVVTNTSVSNTVQDDKGHNGGASANVEPGPDGKIGVTKTAGSHDNEKISWTVTLTVPKTGLKTAQMIDYLPTQYVAGANLYDEWDAATVKVEGLLDGEDMVQDTAASDQTKAVYTFYQDKAHTTTGLKGGDKVRTIIVTFSTKINQDWLEKADKSYMMTHENKVDFVGNGQTVSSSDKVKVTKREIAKSMDQSQTVTIDGKTYPAWHFVIMMKGAAAEDFDVTDTFDARLRYVKPDETVPGLYIGNAGKLTDADGNPYVWNAPVLSADVEDSKVVFHVTKEDVEKFNDIAELHISYWLIPKDEASLKAIMQEAAANGGKTSLTNTASWSGDSAEASATYEYPGLSKKLLTDQSKLKTTDGTQPVAAYEIDANPAGVQMGDGTTLVVRDTMSPNQVLNPQSVSITPSEGSSYQVEKGDDGGQVLTFMIPDNTPVKIVYSATVTGKDGKKTLKNTAELAGYKSTSENEASKSTDVGGSATNYAVTVFKYEEGDLTQKLSGCTFELHMADSTEDAAWKGSGKQFTTGNDGTVIVESTEGSVWGLKPDRNYYLIEVKAPEGYQLDKAKHFFSISEDGTIDETKNVYMNGATIAVSDKKEEQTPDNGSLEIEKTTSGAATPADTIFTISGPNGYKVEKKYSEFTDGKLTLEKLPVGEYTVTENTDSAKVANYTLNVTGNGGKAQVVKGETATVTIKNTYSQEVGSLEIVKTTSGAATPAGTTFTISGPNGYKVEKKYSEFTDGKLKLDNLPVGEYTVTENTGSAAVENYSLSVTGNGGKAQVVKGETAAVTITNMYSKEVGSLKIEKTTSGAATPADTIFTISGPNGYKVEKKYSEFTDGKLTLEKLPVGEYTVTENTDSAKVANYTLNVTGNGGKAQVVKGETATVTIKNTYSQEVGSLEIVKTTSGATTPAGTTFTISGPNGYKVEKKYSEFTDGKLTLENLPVGEYTVTEDAGSAAVENYSLTVTGNGGKAQVAKDRTAAVTITNMYSQEEGSLKIEKTTSGATTPADTIFTIIGPNGYKVEKKYSEFTDGKLKLDNLPVGEYTVTENTGSAAVENYSLSVTGNGGKAQVVKGETATVTIKNTYSQEEGSLEIVKTTSGAETPADTIFTISGPNGYKVEKKYSEFTDGKLTLENLPVGEYTVTEDAGSAAVTNYTLTVSGDNGKVTTVKKDETTTVSITNTYSKEVGSLEIEKTTSGDVATPTDTTFTIAGPNKYSNTVKYSEFTDGKLTLEKLPVGEYTVTENTDSAKVANYTLNVTGNGGKAQVAKDKTATVTIKNEYSRDKGSLKITKSTEGGVKTPEKTEFKITGPDGVDQTYHYSDFTNGVLMVNDLPTGTYTVKELTDTADVKNYTLTVTGNSQNAVVTKDSTPSVKITNHYDKKTGGLTVSKTVVGGDKAKAFNFTVTLDDKTISGTYGGMTFEKGVATFQLKDGEEKKADGLPFGTGYEVTEAPAAGYTQAVTGEKGAIVPDSTLTAAFINTYGTKAASVALGGEKTLQGYPDNAKKPTFRFVLKDKEKTIGTATTEGQGNFTFDTLTFEKEGTYEYTVSEQAGTADGITYDQTVYTVTVTVTDDKAGQLTAKAAVKDQNGKEADTDELNFINKYKAAPVEATLTARKTLNGAVPADKAFTFTLTDATDEEHLKTLQTAANDGKGIVTFKTLTYNQPGEYHYQITENTAAVGSVVTDQHVWNAQVSVTDDGTGKLKAEVIYGKDRKEAPEFKNTLTLKTSKTDLTSGAEVKGAKISVYNADGKAVTSWTSDGTEHDFGPSLEAGRTYTIVEECAPAGYDYVNTINLSVGRDGKMTVTGTEGDFTYDEKTGKLTIQDKKLDVKVDKTDITGDKEVPGATIEVVEKETGRTVETWTSDGKGPHDIGGKLESGRTYTLKETGAPQGYAYTTDVTFKVEKDGTLTDENGKKIDGNTVLVKDEALTVKIDKTDITGDKEVPGATIEVVDKETGRTVDTWTSDGKGPHDISDKLESGRTYTLKETGAPQGYAYTTDVTFKVEKDGTLTDENGKKIDGNTVLVKDEALTVKIDKTDITGDKEVPGATIEVVEKETGRTVDTWTSDGKGPHDIGDKLESGRTYTLKETGAPQGYAYTTDVTFKVEKDGTLTDENGKKIDGNTVLVKDEALSLKVSKTDLTSGAEVKGAKITVYDVDGKAVMSWTSDGTEHDFGPSLEAGRTYTIAEDGAPAGYAYVNKISLSVGQDGKMTVTGTEGSFTYDEKTGVLTIQDEKLNYQVEKVGPDGKPLSGAVLKATDSDGKEVDRWTSDGKAHALNTSAMEAGRMYTLTEETAPSGYQTISPIGFELAKDGSLILNGKTYPNGSTIRITDQKVTVSKPTTPTTGKTGNVKTGDTSNAALPLAAGSLALLAIALILFDRKRRQA